MGFRFLIAQCEIVATAIFAFIITGSYGWRWWWSIEVDKSSTWSYRIAFSGKIHFRLPWLYSTRDQQNLFSLSRSANGFVLQKECERVEWAKIGENRSAVRFSVHWNSDTMDELLEIVKRDLSKILVHTNWDGIKNQIKKFRFSSPKTSSHLWERKKIWRPSAKPIHLIYTALRIDIRQMSTEVSNNSFRFRLNGRRILSNFYMQIGNK